MSALLLLLVKVNLAMGAAIVLVALLRRPLRLSFGAPIAYAIWFLVPVAGVASLLPPRVAAQAPVTPVPVMAAPASVFGHIAHSAWRVSGQWIGTGAPIAVPATPAFAMPDIALLLFLAWILGAVLMTLYLTRSQLRFHLAVRAGKAGPAVLGFLRPRIVTPDNFQMHFTPQEQAAILAHERVHLSRQDARINALAALLRCLCWFNPLIHLGAWWLRIDQELACDASVVAGAISRRTYANALLKSQLVIASLPLGCNWPGSQHPLVERIALLKCNPPGAARRLTGAGLVLLAAASAGLGAWAAQPPVAAKPVAARQAGMALATLPARVPASIAAPSQTAGAPAAAENPASSGNDADDSRSADGAVLAAPARVLAPRTVSIDATTQSDLAAPPPVALVSEPPNTLIAGQTSQDMSQEAADASGPRPRTEGALQCILGFEPEGCGTALWGHEIWGMPYCANQYIHAWEDGCDDGALEQVDYLGTNARGEDVYQLQYTHADVIVGIAPRTSFGRMGKFWIKRGNPNAITPSSLADVSASAARKMTLYRRTPVAAAQADTPTAAAPAPRTRTEPALGCLLGFGSWRCPDGAVTPARWCGEMYEERWLGDCRQGPLETVDYLGTNGAGADVYDVRFRHVNMTYVIAPPSPSEKKGGIWIGKADPEAITPSSLVDVSVSTAGKMNLYRSVH